MNKKDCYNRGYDTGYNIASGNRSDYNLRDEQERDKFLSDMIDHESDIYRQYTPFEFFAHDINSCGDRADSLWESYETGVYNGIMQVIKKEVNLITNNHE